MGKVLHHSIYSNARYFPRNLGNPMELYIEKRRQCTKVRYTMQARIKVKAEIHPAPSTVINAYIRPKKYAQRNWQE